MYYYVGWTKRASFGWISSTNSVSGSTWHIHRNIFECGAADRYSFEIALVQSNQMALYSINDCPNGVVTRRVFRVFGVWRVERMKEIWKTVGARTPRKTGLKELNRQTRRDVDGVREREQIVPGAQWIRATRNDNASDRNRRNMSKDHYRIVSANWRATGGVVPQITT